jgi:hypothetical protein
MIGGFNIPDYLRSLSFGGLVGAGLSGLAYLKFPYLSTVISLSSFILCGGLVGGAIHRVFARISEIIFHPIGRFITYYEQQVELMLLLQAKRITMAEYEEINARLTRQRFLGKEPPDKPQLPPATT